MKKLFLFIFLIIQSDISSAQYENIARLVDQFQKSQNYDSIIIYGNDLLKFMPLDTSIDGKKFYSYFLSKLSLAYNEYNLIDKSDILFEIFKRDTSHIDLSQNNIISFLNNILRLHISIGNLVKADSITFLSSDYIFRFHKEIDEAHSNFLSGMLLLAIKKNKITTADTILNYLKNVTYNTYSATIYINSAISLANEYRTKKQDYLKCESLLSSLILTDSSYRCGERDQVEFALFDLYSETNQIERILNNLNYQITIFQYKVDRGKVDIFDIYRLVKYLTYVADNNIDSEIVSHENIYIYIKRAISFLPKEYVYQSSILLNGIGLVFEKKNKNLAKQAYLLALEKAESAPAYFPYLESIYTNLSRFYSSLYFDSNTQNNIYLDSLQYFANKAIKITYSQYGETSSEYLHAFDALANYYYWKRDFFTSLNSFKYIYENGCRTKLLPSSRCRGYLYTISLLYKNLNDSVQAIKYLNEWNESWRNYIFQNKSFLLPNYESNEELADKIEQFNGDVIRNNYTSLFNKVLENLFIFKYYQLSSKLELKKFSNNDIDNLTNIKIDSSGKTIQNRRSLENILNGKSDFSQKKVVENVFNILNSNEVIIEIFKGKFPSFLGTDNFTEHYYALLAFGDTKEIKEVYLGEDIFLKDKFQIIYNSKIHGDDYNVLYGYSNDGLSNFLLKPLLSFIEKYSTLYISSYGLFSHVNYNILPINNTEILEDKFVIHNIFSSTDIQRIKTNPFIISNDCQINLFGGIVYDSINTSKEIFATSKRDDYKTRSGKQNWEYLPESRKEIYEIGNIFLKNGYHVNSYTGETATENLFYATINQSAQNIYHFATHGFSFDNKNILGEPNRNKSKYNQLDMSGIILAGANKYWGTQKIGESDSIDGILTSAEFAALNLSNCNLIVLSACETGLGIQLSNDGIFGLQRGLKLAGINNIITSLWAVPDKSTKELFVLFYSYLNKGYNPQKSLQFARKDMRRKYKSPYYWGAFTLLE